MSSQYFTRRSVANADAKNNGYNQNFVRSYTPSGGNQNLTHENQNASAVNTSSTSPDISTSNTQLPIKVEGIKDDELGDNQDAATATRSPGHEHFRKLKEARKRAGLLKVDKKLKKKRLNARLEKVLKPKNAFLIFNELNLKPEYNIQENIRGSGFPRTYTALLKLDGRTYSGEGLNVAGAKMVAADVALKDWFTRFFKKAEPNTIEVTDESKIETNNCEENKLNVDREPAPWSAVGSYAMHLLFTRWQMDVNAITSSTSLIGDDGSSVSLPPSIPNQIPSAGSLSGSISCVPSAPKSAKFVSELVNYTASASPKFPPNPEQCQPLYVFNLAFPNVPFVETVNEASVDERFQLQCMINNVTYLTKARNKKDARRMIAVQVLNNFGLHYPAMSSPTAAVTATATATTTSQMDSKVAALLSFILILSITRIFAHIEKLRKNK